MLQVVEALPATPPLDFGSLLATIIDDWCTTQRSLAFAWRSTQLAGRRDTTRMGLAVEWQGMWDAFWVRISHHCGLDEHADLIGIFFDAESFQHLIRWNRVVDRAALQELCDLFVARLNRATPSPAPWRAMAKALIPFAAPVQLEGTAAQIARAALTTLGREGSGGLTHRAVASEANLSLGAVSYHFTSAADLLNGAYLALVQNLTAEGYAILQEQHPLQRGDYLPILIAFATSGMSDQENRAIDELRLLCAGDPALLSIASRMRYERGRSSQAFLSRMPEFARKLTPLDGTLLSTWTQGLRRRGAFLEPELRRGHVETAVTRYFDLLSKAPDGD